MKRSDYYSITHNSSDPCPLHIIYRQWDLHFLILSISRVQPELGTRFMDYSMMYSIRGRMGLNVKLEQSLN